MLTTRRRQLAVSAVGVLAVAVVIVAATDPFGTSTPTASGVSDNAYPTATATVTERDLSSQTSVSATLGYAGSYTVVIPAGTAASSLTEDEETVSADETKVANDTTALASAKAASKPTNASTLLADEQTVSTDEEAVKAAKTELAADEQLSCPAASSTTVTTAIGGSSVPSSAGEGGNSSANTTGSSNTGSGNGSGSTGSSSSSSTTGNSAAGNSGAVKAHLTAAVTGNSGNSGSGNTGNTESVASAPSATTGPVDSTSNTGTTLMGSVDPDGSDTNYLFEYGTSANYGETTTSIDAGSGSVGAAVSASLSGLSPGATYHYRLVARNALGTEYGEDATFTTNAPPVAVTGTASTVSATSESLAGTVTPGGVDTSYSFEWGTTSSFGHITPATDAGAGMAANTVTATITGLAPGTTYDFALVATSSLGTSVGATVQFEAAASSCVAERAVIKADQTALSEAKDALSLDKLGAVSSVASAEQAFTTDEATLAAAKQALATDEDQAANPNTTFTALPIAGTIISRGQTIYALDGEPVPLLYGTTSLYRSLFLGVSDGPDVAELEANLVALGFLHAAASGHFSTATEAAVEAWQRSLGIPATGVVALGDVVLEPGAIEVDTVSAAVGASASAGGTVLTATSTTREVTIGLDASQQSEVKVGHPVTVTLPDNTTTPGVVSSVGTVAVAPSSGGTAGNSGGSSTPTITVEVTLTDPKATGDLDQAPVSVAITNASVQNALVVPVDALLALSSGGYALEEIDAGGSHHLVPVALGLFDDADGLVQVTGAGVAAGQKIVVPNT